MGRRGWRTGRLCAGGGVRCHSGVTQHQRSSLATWEREGGSGGEVVARGSKPAKGNLKPHHLFSPFDCVRHFELEKRLSFVLFQIIRGNRIGDSEYKEDPFDPTLPKVTLHTPSPWSTRRQTVSTLGDEAAVLRAFLRAPADPAPLGHKG